jgi:hypothetical protein
MTPIRPHIPHPHIPPPLPVIQFMAVPTGPRRPPRKRPFGILVLYVPKGDTSVPWPLVSTSLQLQVDEHAELVLCFPGYLSTCVAEFVVVVAHALFLRQLVAVGGDCEGVDGGSVGALALGWGLTFDFLCSPDFPLRRNLLVLTLEQAFMKDIDARKTQ